MLQPWTNMLYVAAETVRDRTVLELRDVHATWIGWADGQLARHIIQESDDWGHYRWGILEVK